MPIRYDGRSIIRHNIINYDAYKEYERKQALEDKRLTKLRMQKLSKESYSEWIKWCPENFKDASIESIGKHDDEVMRTLYEAVKISEQKGTPQSLIIGSRKNRINSGLAVIPKGKTWAMYAYISALCNSHIITDPINQVYITDEVTMIDNNINWRDDGQFMNTVFSPDHRLVVVENINSDAGAMKRKKYGDDAWGRFVAAAEGKNAGIVMLFSGDYDDMSLRDTKKTVEKLMDNASKAILTQGVAS